MSEEPQKVLIVDDEHDVEMLFRQHFRREVRSKQIELHFAFSGSEAIEFLSSENPPEVMYMFSDINMPGMSGLELLEYVKKNHPHIAVRMISAYGDDEHQRSAFDRGAEGFLTKPVDFSKMRELILNSK